MYVKRRIPYLPIVLLLWCTTKVSCEEGHCIWYGVCGKGYNNAPTNCFYNGTAKPLNDTEGLKLLKEYCPTLYKGPNTKTCCNTKTLQNFAISLDLPHGMLVRCPSCFYNFRNLYCAFTCDSEQSKYVSVTKTVGFGDKFAVKDISYAISKRFADGLFDSCKNVQMPSSNSKALAMMCGASGKQCTIKKWLDYMGSTDNGHSPLSITFNITNSPWNLTSGDILTPMNYSILPCNSTLDNKTAPCSCQDCRSSCPVIPPEPDTHNQWKILYIDAYAFIWGSAFIGFFILFMSYVICENIVCQNSLGLIDGQDIQSPISNYPVITKAFPNTNNILIGIGDCLVHGLDKGFRMWGCYCAKHPILVLLVGFVVSVALSCGIINFTVITDPVLLWSAPDSQAHLEKKYYDDNFVPFYRTEMMIVTRPGNHSKVLHHLPPPSTDTVEYNPIFDKEFMHEVLRLQNEVAQLTATYGNETIGLKDICFSPLSPSNNNCTIQSIFQYFQNDPKLLDKINMGFFFVHGDYLEHIENCALNPTSMNETNLGFPCMGDFGGPVNINVALGGLVDNDIKNARAFPIIYIVNNHNDEKANGKAEAWEKKFIEFLETYSNPNLTVSFAAERSIQDELDRESKSDVVTILISYIMMFVYISLALGRIRSFLYFETILVDSKITLGLGGVLMVLMSVGISLGIFSYIGQPATLIIIEVVPFLVLAVGVDNIFILVQRFQRDTRQPNETLESQIGRIVGNVGPSMLLTSLSESVAFFLGALTTMPAVRMFSLYAGMAVFCNFLLQITCFIGLMTLDARRQQGNRSDVLCCIKLKDENQEDHGDCLYSLIKNYYARFITKNYVRPIVIVIFALWFCISGAMMMHVEIGLDQSLSMPKDSYMLRHFNNLSEYLSVGPPVYFVVQDGLNYSSLEGQNQVCGVSGCNLDSLEGQIFMASLQKDYSRIATSPSSWIDDYFDWINPNAQNPCCRYFNSTGKFCNASVIDPDCVSCNVPMVNRRPSSEDFAKYLPWFLNANPSVKCAKGGHAAYASAVQLNKNKTKVEASYFMAYHTVLKNSTDYIEAYKHARMIAGNITKSMNATGNYKVFPYSVFYVFYEQYLTIVSDSMFNIGICCAAIFLITFILMGFDFYTAFLVVFTIVMIMVDMMGMMYLWDINLNALSLVNLVMAVGISVEFCSHIARAFALANEGNRVSRARYAIAHTGSSVMSGITLTKLVGIMILAFSKSQLFQVFYFRMYLGMVIFGATHGLMFLPVLLSYVGPPERNVHSNDEFSEESRPGEVEDKNRRNGRTF